jgi:hypothetical protein
MSAVVDERVGTPTSSWRSMAIPREHGGWGLTLEPVVLGLLVAWSVPGLLLGVAAFGAFLARTPLKFVAVDLRRRQWRSRSAVAARIAGAELAVVAAAVSGVVVATGWRWVLPAAVAAPLVAVEAWYDVRSRSRRVVPELCGAIGISATAAAIVLADRDDVALAAALWLVLAGRSAGSIPFVRAQIARLHCGVTEVRSSDLAQLLAVTIGMTAAVVDRKVIGGAIAIVVIAAVQVVWSRRPIPPIKLVGFQQLALGLALVAATAIGFHLA